MDWGKEVKTAELMAFFAGQEFVDLLKENHTVLRSLFSKAIREGHHEIIHWMLKCSVPLAQAEVSTQSPVFSEFGRGRFSQKEVNDLMALDVNLDVESRSGKVAFKNSETFPYDHQVILSVEDPEQAKGTV